MCGEILMLGVCVAVLVACKQPEVKEQAPRSVKVKEVIPLNVIEKSYSGVVTPDQFSDLAFKMSGPLITLKVEEGFLSRGKGKMGMGFKILR